MNALQSGGKVQDLGDAQDRRPLSSQSSPSSWGGGLIFIVQFTCASHNDKQFTCVFFSYLKPHNSGDQKPKEKRGLAQGHA